MAQRRLTADQHRDAIADFVDDRYPAGTAPSGFLAGCTVLYRDDEATGRSFYQVVDAQGHGDGSGTWTLVE